MTRDEILRLDRAHVWHPYTPIDAWEKASPIVVARAEGVRLFDVDGREYLDGNSSWWVASLGHSHPRLVKVLREQAATLDHCALGGTTHEPAAALAAELAAVAPRGLSHVFYTDNGSTSIEVAVKMAIQTWQHLGAPKKTRFLVLDGAYHGDTVGASSLGGVEVFRRPFASVLFECIRAPFPEPDAYERAFTAMLDVLRREKDSIAAVFVEPLVQGAAGMRMYPPAYLRALRDATREADVLLVLDEVFTGYGRTGSMWASDHAGISPDIMCIGKAFASMLPMAATLASDRIYDAFRGGGPDRALWYGHTFCGHPLGAALAREVLAIYREEGIVAATQPKSALITGAFERLATIPGVARVRSLGMIGAADLGDPSELDYLGDLGWRVYEEAKKRGAYLRPLGNTVYVCPPLVIDDADLERLLAILEESVRSVMGTLKS
ncbi:MAG: adenosylmethionine--8-amino-7-oxononanoate transaminase [Deltaproteobacteria bacterium]|nr:adenosylmethionine--8-amino-7-oxononanoate transaminase [Deltaproteobacteria bacterium]